jgi:Mg-chelatase subunit ChlD
VGNSERELTPAEKWFLGAAVFVLAGVGTFVTQYLSGAYQTPDRTVGLVAGSVLVGLASALPVVVGLFLPLIERLLLDAAPKWPRVLPVVGAGVIAVAAVFGLGPQVNRLTNEWWGCAPSSEFTVITTPAVRATADELLAAFEESTARANDGCPTAHGFVYDADEQTITGAVRKGWMTPPDQTAFPLRDIGPRPDVWLTESTLPLNTLYDLSGAAALGDVDSFGLSPVVLAVPEGVEPPPGDDPLPALVDSLSNTIGVVRPDPRASTVGLLATAALYGKSIDRSHSEVAPAVAGDLALEQQLGVAATTRSFPDGDEGALLCRFRQLTDGHPALVLSEQAVRRYNAEQPVGGPCPGRASAAVPLTPVYAATPALDHRAVRFTWSEGPKAPAAAEEFTTWLTSTDGQRAVAEAKLRPAKADDEAAENLVQRGDLEPQALANVRRQYLAAHRPRRVVLAVDLSGSMDRPSREPRTTRGALVRKAVADAACAIRSNDEIGLWVFPGESPARARVVVPPAPGGCVAVAGAVPPVVPAGRTPLFQTIVDGVEALRGTDDDAERRLVVVTDGEDTSSAVNGDDVLRAVADAEVKVYVVTLGDVTCDAEPLREVADSTGGRCYDPGATAVQIRDALGA